MNKKIRHFIGVAVFALTLTSCGFPNIFKVRLKTLTISDSVTKTYVVGESYFDFADLTITGKYSDGTTSQFERDEVTFSLTSDGHTYDVSSPFEAAGTYKLRASKEGVKSNALTINVAAQPEYVTSLDVASSASVAINKTISLTLTISPANYTVPIEASIASSSIASLTKVSDTQYNVKGLAIGETDVTFRALRNESEYITASTHISVTENYVESITVSGVDNVAKQSSVTWNLVVNPSDFSVDMTAESSNPSIASVTKINNTTFKVNGLVVGTATITFKALSGPGTYATATKQIEVLNIVKTNIEQTYKTLSNHSYFRSSTCPLSGDVKLLVIPTWFTDSGNYITSAKKETVREDIRIAYFGSTTEAGWHSVSSFYFEESSGALNLTGTVSEWWNSGISSTTAKDENYDTGALVKSAANWYFANHTDNKTDYDSDHDKYFDGVMLIYACPNYATLGEDENNLWAYCYWVNNPTGTATNPGVNVFFWASYDFMYDSSNVLAHTGKNYAYYGSDCSHCNIDAHTYIHEMGHVFGLEDYYDYAGTTSPAAGFSMQDHNVGGHDAFSVMAFGWADPYIPTSSCDITINDFQSSRDMILLTPSWNEYNSPFDEYLLLELFSPTGLNYNECTYSYGGSQRGPSVAGIRLWHVNSHIFKTSDYSLTSNANQNAILGAFNNTSDIEVRPCYGTYIDESYQAFNLLQLIRAGGQRNSFLSNNDLFKQGNSFSMSAYSSQFVNGTTLDIDGALGWSFSVTSIVNNGNQTYSATIHLTRS